MRGNLRFAVLAAAAIALATGAEVFAWLRQNMVQPATPAVVMFDADAAGKVESWVMRAHEPAVALAQSILNEDAVAVLAKQAGVGSAAEFRAHLELAQLPGGLLQVRYRDGDKESSAAANAVAKMLAAWTPAPVVVSVSSVTLPQAPAMVGPPHRRRTVDVNTLSEVVRQLEGQLTAIDQQLNSQELVGHYVDLYRLRLERGRLTEEIAAAKRRLAIARDQAAAKPENTETEDQASPPPQVVQAPVQETMVLKNPFTLSSQAGDAVPARMGRQLLYAIPAGLLCGLVYLAGAMRRNGRRRNEAGPDLVASDSVAEERATLVEPGADLQDVCANGPEPQCLEAQEEVPFPELIEMLNRSSSEIDEEAQLQPDGQWDAWAQEVQAVLTETSLGWEECTDVSCREAHAGKNGARRYEEIMQAVHDKISHDPNIWMAHTEAARAAMAAQDFERAAREMQLAIDVAPEKLKAGIAEVALQMKRALPRAAPVTSEPEASLLNIT